MTNRKVTIFLGAGASTAYRRDLYPSLRDLFTNILQFAKEWRGNGGKLRLFLTYALKKAYGLKGSDLEQGTIPAEIIQKEFERVSSPDRKPFLLTTLFRRFEEFPGHDGTRAYWALAHVIAAYMWKRSQDDLNSNSKGHAKLLALIDEMLSNDMTVNVIDFNLNPAWIADKAQWEAVF